MRLISNWMWCSVVMMGFAGLNACSSDDASSNGPTNSGGPHPGQDAGSSTTGTSSGSSSGSPSSASDGGTSSGSSDGSVPSGWLSTSGNHIYLGTNAWVGRGADIADIQACSRAKLTGDTGASQLTDLEKRLDALLGVWHATFIRFPLNQNQSNGAGWVNNTDHYRDLMISAIEYIGSKYPGVYVELTDYADPTFDTSGAPAGKTCCATAATYPYYQSLVDTFKSTSYVLFGLTNEPEDSWTDAKLWTSMNGAASAIRMEEDKVGSPHHIIVVQGKGYTSDDSYYNTHPITAGGAGDNIAYEIHGYMPAASSYSGTNVSNLPIIIGEYGSASGASTSTSDFSAFWADVDTKQVPHLAWIFDPDCTGDIGDDLVDSNLNPTSPVGVATKNYLLSK